MKKTKRRAKDRILILLLLLLMCIVFFSSFFIGRYSVGFFTTIKILISKFINIITFNKLSLPISWSGREESVVLAIRFPRIMSALLIGAALSVSGAAFQATFRNPMVSSDLLGASNGAGFGAALVILVGGSYFSITLSSFVFGLLAVFLALLVSSKSRVGEILSMVLSGVMISSLFSSATSFLKLVADTESQLPAITYWLMGSLTSVKNKDLLFASIPIILGFIPIFLLRWRINLLTLPEGEAESMGVNVKLLRIAIVLSATLMTAGSVSISGQIGWVGLIIPHFSRFLFGDDNTLIIPSSALLGATFLMVVDNLSRIITTSEIPLGILTSFIGAPFFIYLIVTGGRKK